MNPNRSRLMFLLMCWTTGSFAGELGLVTGNPGSADEFGFAVAADGELLLAGAPSESNEAGAAYLFRCQTAACVRETRMSAPSPTAGHQFGAELLVSANTLFVAAPGQSGGRVHVFQRSAPGAVAAESVLAGTDTISGDAFGRSLALHGDTLVVGAPGDDGGRGSVYVFIRQGPAFKLQWHLFAWDGIAGDRFGTDVAIHGDRVVVGAPMEGGVGVGSLYATGAVYVFTRSAGLWSPDVKLQAPVPISGNRFGRSVALGAARLVIAAPGTSLDTGAIHWYEKPAATWQNLGTLAAPAPLVGQRFGWQLSMVNDQLLVGAPFAALPEEAVCGQAAQWITFGSGFNANGTSMLRVPAPGDVAGWSVAISTSGLFLGVPGRVVTTTQVGAAAWFDPSLQMFDDTFDRSDLCP